MSSLKTPAVSLEAQSPMWATDKVNAQTALEFITNIESHTRKKTEKPYVFKFALKYPIDTDE